MNHSRPADAELDLRAVAKDRLGNVCRLTTVENDQREVAATRGDEWDKKVGGDGTQPIRRKTVVADEH